MKKTEVLKIIICMMAAVDAARAAEIDVFENSQCVIELQLPGGQTEELWLTGTSTTQVFFAGAAGQAIDNDSDGLDDVSTQMTAFTFAGISPSLGPLNMQLSGVQTNGQIEEQANNAPGLLDIPPFAMTGTCSSFFDIFLEVTVAGQTLHNDTAKRLTAVLSHEPPAAGDLYENTATTPLLDADGNPTAFALKITRYRPNPPTQIDVFAHSRCMLQLTTPDQGVQTVQMNGVSAMRIFFDGLAAGSAQDDDNNGLEDAQAELTQWVFGGNNPALGSIQLHALGNTAALGQLEEQANNAPGTLDIPPFAVVGTCDSFFDIFLEVQLPGMLLHSHEPIRLSETVSVLPPVLGDTWENVQSVQLYDQDDNSTRYYAAAIVYEPSGPYCGDPLHPYPQADLSHDCRVNLADLAIMAAQWLDCTAPECQ